MWNDHLILAGMSSVLANYAAGPASRPGRSAPRAALPSLSSRATPLSLGKGWGLPIGPEQQPSIAGAP